MTKREFLNIARGLEGEIPISVKYFEIDHEEYSSDFTKDSKYDCLDYGINIKMQSGKVFGFIWGSEFTQYGVSILRQSLQTELKKCREVDVSKFSNWTNMMYCEIQKVEVVWQWVKESGFFKKKRFYPQSVVLVFDSEKTVVISALEISDSSHWGMADNIVVFFDQNSARNYGVVNA
jgi:hypothetical protein